MRSDVSVRVWKALAGPAQAAGWPGTAGAVYTTTNSPAGNAIEAYARAADGSLIPAGTYRTGGDGGTLDPGHPIVVSRDGTMVVNVNASSDSVSAFAATPRGLRPADTASSGGTDPNSVTIAGDHLVYVLNAGSKTIADFWLGDRGLVRSRARSSRSAAERWCRTDPVQQRRAGARRRRVRLEYYRHLRDRQERDGGSGDYYAVDRWWPCLGEISARLSPSSATTHRPTR